MTVYRGKTIAYYAVLIIGLCLIVTSTLGRVIPGRVAAHIGRNSESLLFAVSMCAIAQFVVPRLRQLGMAWTVTVPCAAMCFVAGYALIHSGWPSSLVTLNESVIATGYMFLYVSLRRPLRYAPLVVLVTLMVIVVWFNTAFVVSQAESLVPMLLAPLALDVFDRSILEPELGERPIKRLVWMILLVIAAVTLMLAAPWARTDLRGPVRLAIDYGQRAAEAYWGWLLVHLYFGFWIGRARGWRPGGRRERLSRSRFLSADKVVR